MIIVEYELEKGKYIPYYIVDGGYFPIGDKLIGLVETNELGLKELTPSELITLISNLPYKKFSEIQNNKLTNISENIMTNTEKEDLVKFWLKEKGFKI